MNDAHSIDLADGLFAAEAEREPVTNARARGSRRVLIDAAIELLERFGIRSIFASAFGDPAMRERAERAEPLGWLPKPFSDAKLVATVEGAIKHNEAHPLAP